MHQSDGPTVPPSEPELVRQLFDAVKDEITSADRLTEIHLSSIRDTLLSVDLDVDNEGFIVREKTGAYAEPYAFDEGAFRESDEPADDPFAAYFAPVTDLPGWEQREKRLHLSDLHAVTHDEDGVTHPVNDGIFNLEKFHGMVGLGFSVVAAWSDAHAEMLPEDAIVDKVDHDQLSVPVNDADEDMRVASVSYESDAPLDLDCFAPDCGYSGPPSEWGGDLRDPECPECGGPWKESITVCTACGEWHWGTHITGGYYATPSCPECGEGDMEHLERQTRYDEF